MRLLVLAVLAAAAVVATADGICDPAQRSDCGYFGIDQQQCESKGCCWQPAMTDVHNDIPWCFHPVAPPSHYAIQSVTQTATGYTATLKVVPGHRRGMYGLNIDNLRADIVFESADRVRIKITDPREARWEVPEDILPTPGVDKGFNPKDARYSFHYISDPASFAIVRKADGVAVFNSSELQYQDQFLQITNSIAQHDAAVYGMGEHIKRFKLTTTNSHSYTMWNADVPTPVEHNIYGTHPFYLEMRNGNAHGVFLRNSNGMDVIFNPGKVTYKVIGGILDFYVLMGPKPEQVIQQYHAVIGKPYFMPFWALGWHQCRYGYKDLAELQSVLDRYAANEIPLDTIWSDIDYMDKYEDFTWDPVHYPLPEVQKFVQRLHANGQKYIVIIDPGIHNRPGYLPWEDGLKRGVFITTKDGKTPFIGNVWPGDTAFPDFLNPETTKYWRDHIVDFLNDVPIDGLWIDMNEASNFYNGLRDEDQQKEQQQPLKIRGRDVNNPPYKINNFNNRLPLNTKAIAMDALHYGNITEYDAHNLYGHTEAIATRVVLEEHYKKRAFVVSRSTFPGSGSHAAHWLGDNHASWEDLHYSIPGMLDMNMFGIPFVGPDICGFLGPSNEELCARWTALGAFYPFARNHRDHDPPQEPYIWESVTRVAKKTLGARYSLLPYMYTLLYNVHKHGGTMIRALLFEFPQDTATYDIDSQFLIGSGLMVSPVVKQGHTTVWAYFPQAKWYDFWTGRLQHTNGWVELPAGLEDIPVHVRGGSILPRMVPGLTTTATRKNPFQLLVALDDRQSATGDLFWDDGEALDVGREALILDYVATPGVLSSSVKQSTYRGSITPLETITVFGVQAVAITKVTLNGAPHPGFHFNAQDQVLTVTGLKIAMDQPFKLAWGN